MTTPMMAQWQACKEKASDALLFFRLGDFYEAFYDDAKQIARELGLTLTARQGIPMCGVPFHTAETYLDKLIGKGHKVAVAEQTEDPKATKGLVKREIVRILSPGTIVGSDLLSDKRNNFIVSICQQGVVFGLGMLDVTTGEFLAVELEGEGELLDELYRIRPAEILVSRKLKFDPKELNFPFASNRTEDWRYDLKAAHDVLVSHFKVQSLDGFGLKGQTAAISASGALIGYLSQEMALRLDHVCAISVRAHKNGMSLDRSTMRNLELLDSLHEGMSLVGLLDQTDTPMGGRLLRQWIKQPLLSLPEIKRRQDAIGELIGNQFAPKPHLDGVRDLERLMMKIAARYANPRDLLALGLSLARISALKSSLDDFTSPIINESKADLSDPISQRILAALTDSPPIRIGEGEIFKDGYHVELDRLRTLSRDSHSWMNQYQASLREQTGIKSLKVGYTKAFGYYIETSRAQGEKIPEGFQRRQTLVNGERFITDELKKFEHQVLTAEERAKALESQLFEELRAEIALHAAPIFAAAKAIGALDALVSLATVAHRCNWIRPIVDDSEILEIRDGRHPIVEQAIGSSHFIGNDTHLHKEQQLMLITGPNMAGKSTYIRQVALIAILAHLGSYVPARSAHIGLIDKIFSRIGASDDLARGQSTFMVEMAETANILNNATSRSLVLLDEIGRGTSTYDGISIAWAVAEYLLTTSNKQAKTLFATHYWELTRLEEQIKGAVNYQVAVQETSDGIVFLRKIIKGGTDKSYGIHVAKLAGLPYKAIKRAEEMLLQLETAGSSPKRKPKKDEQLSLLPPENPLLEQIRSIDLDRLTPLEALLKLSELKKIEDR